MLTQNTSLTIESSLSSFGANQGELPQKARALSLTGAKKVIDNGEIVTSIQIYEMASISMSLVCEPLDDCPTVYVGVKKIVCSEARLLDDGLMLYRYQDTNPFLNHLGYTNIEIEFDKEVVKVPVEVFSTKATFQDARGMLRYIQNVSPEIINLCFSQTMLPAEDRKSDKVDILRKVELGNRVLQFLSDNANSFRTDPCVEYRHQADTTKYNPERHHIDERGIEWLTRNSQELTLEMNQPHVHIGSIPYQIERMQIYEPFYSTDVFENQVIASFLSEHHAFLSKAIKMDFKRASVHFDDNIYSFDQLELDWNEQMTGPQSKMRRGAESLAKLLRFTERYMPCNRKIKRLPKMTNEVRKRKHYMGVFELIHRYYQAGEPDWRRLDTFSGLKNLAKIYEYYTLVNLLTKIKQCGYMFKQAGYLSDGKPAEKPDNEPNNCYIFEADGRGSVTLLYEPIISKNSGGFPNYKGLHKASRDIEGFGRGHLKPDFVLLSKDKFVILDAKFTNSQNLDRYYLPELMNKYGVGIQRHLDGHNVLSNGVIGVYAKSNKRYPPMSFESMFEGSGPTHNLEWSGKIFLPPRNAELGAFDGVAEVINSLTD
jgi:hypothetical protein